MKMTLTPEQDAAVKRLVAEGIFASREATLECSHEWLREAAEKLDSLRADLKAGLDELDAGKGAPLDMEDIKRRVLAGMENAVSSQNRN